MSSTTPISDQLAPSAPPSPARPRAGLLERLITVREFGPLVLLIVQIIFFSLMASTFYSPRNISNMLAFIPELGIIALGMTLLLTSGEFDLSVGSVFGFSAVVMWTLYNLEATSLEVGFLIAMVLSVVVGFINGWMVTKVKISSFLVTLGMMLIVRGVALFITNGFPQRTWDADSALKSILVGSFKVGDFTIYASLIWFIVLAVLAHYLLMETQFGNWVRATGGNASSAKARGVNIDRAKIILFIITAALSGFAGIVQSFRISSANPNTGTGYELEIIAMTVIGGTLLSGGRGTIIGTIIGVLLLRSMRNGIIMIGVPGLAFDAFIGVIILAMMSLHSAIERRVRAGG